MCLPVAHERDPLHGHTDTVLIFVVVRQVIRQLVSPALDEEEAKRTCISFKGRGYMSNL